MLESELKNLWKLSGDGFQLNIKRIADAYTLEKKLDKFDRKLLVRNWTETIVGILLLAFFSKDLIFSNLPLLTKLGSFLSLLGILFIIWKLWHIRSNKPVIDPDLALLQELINLKDYFLLEMRMNKTAPLWYMLPLLPGYLFYMIGMIPLRTPVHNITGFIFGIAVSIAVWWLNVKKAPRQYELVIKELEQQIKAWEE